jgi:hypothetical protein
VEQCQTEAGPLFACFVDFRKAYDLVPRNLLWEKLQRVGIDGMLLRSITALYSTYPCDVRTSSGLSPWFTPGCGVKQGCPLSPLLFSLYIDDLEAVFAHHDPNDQMAAPRLEGGAVRLLFYADDIVLLSTSAVKLRHQLGVLHTYCAAWALSVNRQKTEVMIFNQFLAGDEVALASFALHCWRLRVQVDG